MQQQSNIKIINYFKEKNTIFVRTSENDTTYKNKNNDKCTKTIQLYNNIQDTANKNKSDKINTSLRKTITNILEDDTVKLPQTIPQKKKSKYKLLQILNK